MAEHKFGSVDKNPREADYPISDIFINRWSPRAFSGSEVSKEELMSLFEAARWAPSSFNNQPWRFVYALKGTEAWDKFFEVFKGFGFNQDWIKNTGALVCTVSRMTFSHNDKPAKTHTFDTGSAWMSIALQASSMGLAAHGMEGFDYAKAREVLEIPEEYRVEMMFAVGKVGDPSKFKEKMISEEKPNVRKKVSEFAFEGKFDVEKEKSFIEKVRKKK